jgi:hypothetical protein
LDRVDGRQNFSAVVFGYTLEDPNWFWSKTSFQNGVGDVGKHTRLKSFGPWVW